MMRYAVISLPLLPLFASQLHGSLFVNGSFEEGPPITNVRGYSTLTDGSVDIPGWVVKTPVAGRDINYKSYYWQPSDGAFSLDLNGENGPGGIAQTILTHPRSSYEVLFDIAGNPTVASNPVKTMVVEAAGVFQTYTVDNTGRTLDNMGWETRSFTFTAVASQTEVWFQMVFPDYGAEGVGLDNVRGSAISGPSPTVIWDTATGGNGHAYALVNESLTWAEAKLVAEALVPPPGFGAGHLLTISDAAEQEFVINHVGQIVSGGENDGAWAGFSDEAVEGEWRWIDQTPGIWQDPAVFPNPIQTAYVNWESGEPNNASGLEHYLSIRGSGGWNDYATALRGRPNDQYLVEWEPLAVPVIPEPPTIVVWSVLATLALTVGSWRRGQAA